MLLIFAASLMANSCSKGSGGGSSDAASPVNNEDPIESIKGNVSYLLNLLLPSAHAESSACKSKCPFPQQTGCMKLFLIDTETASQEAQAFCSTSLIPKADGTFDFDLKIQQGALDFKKYVLRAELPNGTVREKLVEHSKAGSQTQASIMELSPLDSFKNFLRTTALSIENSSAEGQELGASFIAVQSRFDDESIRDFFRALGVLSSTEGLVEFNARFKANYPYFEALIYSRAADIIDLLDAKARGQAFPSDLLDQLGLTSSDIASLGGAS